MGFLIELLQLPMDERARMLRPLLDRLARERLACEEWQGWHIRRIDGGWCNLLYHVTGDAGDLAVKFTMRDDRDRAGREYHALCALGEADLEIAPKPLVLERHRYALPVVVQTWLPGESSETPPATGAEWEGLLRHLILVHSVTPERTDERLSAAGQMNGDLPIPPSPCASASTCR